MTKAILIDPTEMRKPGVLRAPEILLNQYAPNPQAEATQYGRAALVRIFHDMVVIREFETMLDRIKKEGVYQGIEYQHKGPAHLSIGQEASVVGQAYNLTPEDFIFGSHRSHGEILAKGPNIMMGYYKEPELTKEALDAEGWLHTGDIGELDADGFLKITDRKKEIFKTSGGKYVAPQVLENKLKESRFIEQAMVIGENRKFPAALIVPNFGFLKDYCEIKGIPFESREQVIADKRIVDRIFEEVTKADADKGHWEQVKKIALLPQEMSIEGGELTPSMKLRRKPILAKYADIVERIYAGA